MSVVDTLDRKGYRLIIETDLHDNLKDICLNCDIECIDSSEYVTTIRANDFIDLESKLKNYKGD